VGTTVRLIRQERELVARRAEEDRALLALRIGQELIEGLRSLNDRVTRTFLSPRNFFPLIDSEPAILTLALAGNGRMAFPWEMRPDPSSALDPASFTRYLRFRERAEEAEYREGDFVEAARLYGQAAEVFEEVGQGEEPSAARGEESSRAASVLLGDARVNQARALSGAEQMAEAQAIYLLLAEKPPAFADMEGMPLRIYGLQGLHRTGANPPDLVRLLGETLDRTPHFSLPALLAWRDVARGIANGLEKESTAEVLQAVEGAVAQRMATLEKLENLRTDFSGLLAAVQRGIGARENAVDPSWIPYGKEPWLVGILSDTAGGPTRVTVVQPTLLLGPVEELGDREADTRAVETGDEAPRARDDELWEAARRVTLLPAGDNGGESLGQALNGLRASFPPGFPPPSEGGGVEGWFFRLLLPVILTLTGFTAYLAWRDVRRETEAVRLRSQFVSSVTHELKTPLTSIRMFAETLQLGRHSGPETQQEYLDTVVHETERLSRLINNVLDFARIERGDKTYHMAPTNVGAAAREAARAVAYPLTQGGYTLTTDVTEDLPLVEADSDALTQALLNLLSNAIKFSEEESEIVLRVFRDKGDVLLQVEDRGRGIALQDQEAIFQDFYRTAASEEEGIPGTGLGLSLVAHVAEAHSGRVEVESEVGQGSTFTIRIPMGERDIEEGDSP